ncbi:MAG: hypothetical protein RLZ55_308, partial [Actinomycetota bacterium]
LPFFLQILRGYSTLQAGLSFLPFAVGQLLSAPRSAALVNRFGYKVVMTVGLLVVAGALFGVSTLSLTTPAWLALVYFFLFGLGMGAVVAPASTVMQNVLPLARAGAGSAVQNTVRQVAGALGVAVISTLLATQYAASMKSTVDGALGALPQPAKDAALQSVGGSARVLERAAEAGLPAPVVDDALQHAYDAFLQASHLTSLVSALIVLLAAAVVGFLLPRIAPPQAHPAQAPEQHEAGTVHDIARHTEAEALAAAAELEDDYPAESAEEYVTRDKRRDGPESSA